jgi:hypothetical protein
MGRTVLIWTQHGHTYAVGVGGRGISAKTAEIAVAQRLAEAVFSIRLARGQEPELIATIVTTLLRDAAPAGTRVSLDVLGATPPAMVSPSA